MDYRDYSGLLERYNEVDNMTFGRNETKEDIIGRLIAVSKEKKEIQAESNAIIREYITKYEKNPECMDAEAEKMLQDFMSMLMKKAVSALMPPSRYASPDCFCSITERSKI